MVAVDSNDIHAEYKILLTELREYNPELLDKKRILAITKCDYADQELIEEIEKDLPKIPYVFISSVAGTGITELKDTLWKALNS